VTFSCDPADIDETRLPDEAPRDYVQRMAREKADAVWRRHCREQHAVLAADTTVAIDGDVMGKPRNVADGMAMLRSLSGRSHQVYTAICLRNGDDEYSKLVATTVTFTTLSEQTCSAYLATDEPWDKAGGYGIQGLGGAFVSSISGSYSNVVGLPLCETWQLLTAIGVNSALESIGE
jgi:septum formation protein